DGFDGFGDPFAIVDGGSEQARRSGVTISAQPLDGAVEARGFRADGHQVNVSARVQHEWDAQGLRGLADGANFFHLQGQVDERAFLISGHVLKVHADNARGDGGFHRFDHVFDGCAVACLEIGGDGNVHGTSDSSGDFQHFVAGDALAVRVAERKSYRGAAGGNGRMTAFFQNARANDVPSVGEQNEPRTVVKFPELLGFLGLCANIHRNLHRGTGYILPSNLGAASLGGNGQFGEHFWGGSFSKYLLDKLRLGIVVGFAMVAKCSG